MEQYQEVDDDSSFDVISSTEEDDFPTSEGTELIRTSEGFNFMSVSDLMAESEMEKSVFENKSTEMQTDPGNLCTDIQYPCNAELGILFPDFQNTALTVAENSTTAIENTAMRIPGGAKSPLTTKSEMDNNSKSTETQTDPVTLGLDVQDPGNGKLDLPFANLQNMTVATAEHKTESDAENTTVTIPENTESLLTNLNNALGFLSMSDSMTNSKMENSLVEIKSTEIQTDPGNLGTYIQYPCDAELGILFPDFQNTALTVTENSTIAIENTAMRIPGGAESPLTTKSEMDSNSKSTEIQTDPVTEGLDVQDPCNAKLDLSFSNLQSTTLTAVEHNTATDAENTTVTIPERTESLLTSLNNALGFLSMSDSMTNSKMENSLVENKSTVQVNSGNLGLDVQKPCYTTLDIPLFNLDYTSLTALENTGAVSIPNAHIGSPNKIRPNAIMSINDIRLHRVKDECCSETSNTVNSNFSKCCRENMTNSIFFVDQCTKEKLFCKREESAYDSFLQKIMNISDDILLETSVQDKGDLQNFSASDKMCDNNGFRQENETFGAYTQLVKEPQSVKKLEMLDTNTKEQKLQDGVYNTITSVGSTKSPINERSQNKAKLFPFKDASSKNAAVLKKWPSFGNMTSIKELYLPGSEEMDITKRLTEISKSLEVTRQNSSCDSPGSIFEQGKKIFSWLRRTTPVETLITGAKSSFSNICDIIEFGIAQIWDSGNALPMEIIVATDFSDYLTIRNAFLDVFGERTKICVSDHVRNKSTPQLSLGHSSALQTAYNKIKSEKEQRNSCCVLVSTAQFIFESLPDQWQLSTVIILEDLNLGIHLHNFTQTIQIPVDFVNQLQMMTPADYPLGDYGFPITLKDAINVVLNRGDAQEFPTSLQICDTLAMAADILVHTYYKQIKRMA